MCGICGGIRFGGGEVLAPGVLKAMTDSIVHRGPDAEGAWEAEGVALGFRRLKIIDLTETGDQPMGAADGQVQIVFNGEVYNHHELRRDLEGRGHRYRGRSDTESILYQYLERGPDVFADLRGMFSIAIWDGRSRRLLLARDRVGKKSLYWWTDGERLLFGSELKALLADPLVPREIEPRALADYLTYGYIPAPRTIFKGIHKLEAGTLLDVRADEPPSGSALMPRRYWQLSFRPTRDGNDATARDRAAEELAARLEEAVRLRMESDVPLGAFLSGGVDSSAVVALMSRLQDRPVVTASIGFDDAEFDELPAARAFAKKIGAEAHEMVVRTDALESLDKIAYHFDEPFADASAVPTYYVCQIAREHVTVALSGDGGDEAFAGYRHYRFERAEHRLRRLLPDSLRAPVFGSLAALAPKGDWLPRPLRAKTLLKNLSLSPDRAFAHSASRLKFVDLGTLLKPELAAQLGDYDPGGAVFRAYEDAPLDDPVKRAQHIDMRVWLPEDVLVKVDRASMAHSLEVRAPILDHELLEFAASCPSSWWLDGGEHKALFRQVIRPLVGDAVLDRKKQGFSPPLKRWLLEDLRPRIEDELLGSGSRTARYLAQARMKELWAWHTSGQRDLSDFFWCLLMFETWHRTWLG